MGGGLAIPYRIKKSDHDVLDALRRIAGEQIDKAIASAEGDGELGSRVHDIRKRMKKMRGLIRLVRPVFPDYKAENRHFRDTGRAISGLRDAQVLEATLDRLLERHEDPLDLDAFAPLRERIAAEGQAASDRIDLAPVVETLHRTRERVELWTLHETGWDAVTGGLRKTYKRARKGRAAESDTDLHDWRKRLKYHWYHVRLLRDIWPDEMEAREAAADEVGNLLGLNQDLVVLEQEVRGGTLDKDAIRVLRGLIERRKAECVAEAREIAARLLADKPKALTARWEELWSAWRS